MLLIPSRLLVKSQVTEMMIRTAMPGYSASKHYCLTLIHLTGHTVPERGQGRSRRPSKDSLATSQRQRDLVHSSGSDGSSQVG